MVTNVNWSAANLKNGSEPFLYLTLRPFSRDGMSALMESVNNKKRRRGHLGVQIQVTARGR